MPKINNLEIIASYLFLFPGVSASEIRRVLYCWHFSEIDDNFNEKLTYTTYFDKSHYPKGYVGKLWSSPKRSKWILTFDGLKKIRPEILERLKFINSCVSKKNISYFNKVQSTEEVPYEA